MKRSCRHSSVVMAVLAICLSFCMASCNFFEVMEPPKDYVASYPEETPPKIVTPKEGGVLTIASTKYETLNPLTNHNYYMEEILGLVYDGLVSLSSNLQVVPVLAESLTPSADAREWTVVLRKNMTWHDGKYVSVEDVTHTVQIIQAGVNGKYAHCVGNIASMEEKDAYTVLFKLQSPDSFFAEKLYFPIVPKHTSVDTVPVGTGLYRYAEQSDTKMNFAVYSLNAKIQGKKVPYIPTVQVIFYKNTTEVIYSDCDIVLVKSDDYQKISGKIGYGTKKYISTEYEVLAFQVKKAVLNDSAVRRAIAWAIDRDGAVRTYSKVQGAVTDFPVVPQAWIRSSSQLTYSYDAEKAKRLLSSKNYTKEQLTFSCLVNKENAQRLAYAAYFKKRLEEVGITLQLTEATGEEIKQKLSAGEYDLAFVGMNISQIDQLASYYSTDGSNNMTGYANETLDALFIKLSGYIYENERKHIFGEIENILVTDEPYIGLYYKQHFIFYNKNRVYGIGDINPSFCKKFMNIESWFIAEDT